MSGARDKARSNTETDPIVVVKRPVFAGGDGHHGGAWKVAYADFVTAMMAFFLLMWLLNATSEEQRRGIADYFSNASPLGQTIGGYGQPFSGRSVIVDGARMSDQGVQAVIRGFQEEPPEEAEDEERPHRRERSPQDRGQVEDMGLGRHQESRSPSGAGSAAQSALPADPMARAFAGAGRAPQAAAPPNPEFEAEAGAGQVDLATRARIAAELAAERAEAEAQSFRAAEASIRAAIEADPRLAELARQLLVEHTPEGLRIQLLDAERQPMFALGSAQPSDRTRLLLARVAQVLRALPNAITIAGHTDAAPFRDGSGRTNWDLSADRANATRRLLLEAGLQEARIASVTGHAERQPLVAEDPLAAGNRRVAILLLRANEPPAAAPPAAAPTPAPAGR